MNDTPPICPQCNGSGEGSHDGGQCTLCNGSGVIIVEPDDDMPEDYYQELMQDEEE